MYAYVFSHWIEGFENAVRKRLEEPLTGYEFQDRINDVLEVCQYLPAPCIHSHPLL
jgi:hypothetical protein